MCHFPQSCRSPIWRPKLQMDCSSWVFLGLFWAGRRAEAIEVLKVAVGRLFEVFCSVVYFIGLGQKDFKKF